MVTLEQSQVILIEAERYTFDTLDELYETSEELPFVDRYDVYAHHTEEDEWERIPYRDSLWTDDLRPTGIVSSNQNYYNIIQYGDILKTVGKAVEKSQEVFDLDVHGLSLALTHRTQEECRDRFHR